MSAPDILSNMSRGWNRDPTGVALGTERTGVSVALWRCMLEGPREVTAESDPNHHVLSVQLGSPRSEVYADQRRAFAGRVPRGAAQLMVAGSRPRAVFRDPFEVTHFYLPVSIIENWLASETGRRAGELELLDPSCTPDPYIGRLADEILREMHADLPLSRLRVDALGQDLVIHLLRRWSNLSSVPAFKRELDRGGLAPWQLNRAVEYLMSRLEDDVSITELAAVVRLSPFHFARAFKRSTGLPPQRYLMERRVERARELLSGTDMNLWEIALACGFASQSHFTTAFKRHTGFTPGAWRTAVRQ